ncbi:hypothetical protein BCR39DRAFT_522172 [Naematelia encephala]|uniref:Capsular associated protein n=1 Tax=Naematelia encephala TaxID=71784 RepID=A0A1Y2BDF8_9TREE|nr:hypothetical protein BCR39DRAFT_522172 [Naematelia encephala]
MYIPLPASHRRPHVFLALLLGVAALFFLHNIFQPRSSFLPYLRWSTPEADIKLTGGLEDDDYRIRERIDKMRGVCEAEDVFGNEYGRANLRMSRAYEGSHHRLRQFLLKGLRGEPVTVSAIGGSVTKGHQVWASEIWFFVFANWIRSLFTEDVQVTDINGAAPATGSDYFSFCFPLHIPTTSDLVLVELAINDEGIPEHIDNMENLLRGLLDMENKPAVILVEGMAFSSGGMAGGGGRMHLPVAQYFDVPVINQRHPLANHFGRYPQLVRPYFSQNYWGDPDMRHINARGHRDLSNLVASLIQDVACTMLAEDNFHVLPRADAELSSGPVVDSAPEQDVDFAAALDKVLVEQQSTWPEQTKSWRKQPAEGEQVGELMPGMWNTPLELGVLPRMRALDGWNPNVAHSVPPFHPTCLSTRSTLPEFNLTPSANEGWEFWTHEEHLDKPYLISRTPGARVSFELDTNVGVVKMYSLRSKTFGLGIVECWADDDRDRATKVDGWWDNGEVNIGRFATIREDLSAGRHTITCEISEETSDPGGGHEFRLISIMSV